MNLLRKYLGILWLLLGVILGVYLFYQTAQALSSPTTNAEDYVFWIVIVTIFIPILIGFILFGYYAYKGEYSSEIRK
ncbi:hypothetical protein B0I27_10733 [Arcticibacter pallidicorallinus]|uniref:Uncharacterized protein n=1 Tax=Arcticibacter pallidicorallinus TaxID=1259464 RepID=A0A2T0U0S8_9SPHI|nr:hypothetical protein [Arcticibacter pallidicorallinus]PRY51448.1 hypothetical protein B0I27_10733 [Arcticibacter pallidicorallinus]